MYLWKKKLSTFPVRLSTIYGTDLFGAFLMYPDSSLFSLVVFDQSAPQVSSSGQFSHGSINSAILFSAACILRESICLNAHRTPMSLISCSVNTSPSFPVASLSCFCISFSSCSYVAILRHKTANVNTYIATNKHFYLDYICSM